MKRNNLQMLVTAAALAALTCVATMVVNIPIPGTKGYVNAGDCVALLSGLLLGPLYGALAGGLGSALADLFLGYVIYAPGTAVIKGLTALFAALLYRALRQRTKLAVPAATVAAELWMVAGYFLYESTVLGLGLGALAAVPANLGQAAGGVGLSIFLFHALYAAPPIRRFIDMREYK